jgi:asparagine synthase (glutamine-hydrolysing)
MHFGLEARVPFANQSYLRAACQIPPHLGFKGSTEKHILRQAAQKWLPPLFSERKKSALPRDPRLGKAYQNALLPLIQRHKDLIEPYLDIPALLSLCHIENVKEADRMILFNMISFIHWFTIYAKK